MSDYAEKQEANNDAARKALIDFVKREDRFVTSFERIAAALELIAQKMPWPITLNTQPFVPYQPLQQPTIFSSPNTNGTAVPSGSTVIPMTAFEDLTEGRPMRVGTGG